MTFDCGSLKEQRQIFSYLLSFTFPQLEASRGSCETQSTNLYYKLRNRHEMYEKITQRMSSG